MYSKTSYDKWLCNAPEDKFDSWCEDVINAIDDDTFAKGEDWFINSSGECNQFLNKFFDNGCSTKEAAEKIKKIFLEKLA